MLDPNVERYIEIAVEPLKKEINKMKTQIETINTRLNVPDLLDIPALIRTYSDKGFFIEVLADGYKLDIGICWRGYVHWKQNEEWVEEDCGCFTEWLDAFNSSVNFINDWVGWNSILKTK